MAALTRNRAKAPCSQIGEDGEEERRFLGDPRKRKRHRERGRKKERDPAEKEGRFGTVPPHPTPLLASPPPSSLNEEEGEKRRRP